MSGLANWRSVHQQTAQQKLAYEHQVQKQQLVQQQQLAQQQLAQQQLAQQQQDEFQEKYNNITCEHMTVNGGNKQINTPVSADKHYEDNSQAKPGYLSVNTMNPNDNRIPSSIQGFNRRWNASNCKQIYSVLSTSGTEKALTEAIKLYGNGVRFLSGGHCYENFVFNDKTKAIIDVTPMNGYGYEEGKGYYLETGNSNWTAFSALFRNYGKVLPSGSCYSVGLGGHICGGGYGLLSRLNGLTVDWLTGVEVVVKDKADKDAYAIYVSEDDKNTNQEKYELYWAHRGGGGGNFGCITRYYFKTLPDAPQTAFLTTVAWPWSKLTTTLLENLLNWYYNFAARSDNWRQFGLFKLNHQSVGELQILFQTVVLNGEDKNIISNKFILPLLDELNNIMPFTLLTAPTVNYPSIPANQTKDTLEYTFKEVVQTLNGSGSNQRFKNKSSYHTKPFTSEQVNTLFTQLQVIPVRVDNTPIDMSQTVIQIDSYGGLINTKISSETAVFQRSSIMKTQWQTYWTDPADDQYYLKWMSTLYTDVFKTMGGTPNPKTDPTNSVQGCYYNYPDVDLNGPTNDKEIALNLYFGDNLHKLKQVKKRWDPNNYFNGLQSIPVE